MRVIVYGHGGYMPDRPDINFNVVEDYECDDHDDESLLGVAEFGVETQTAGGPSLVKASLAPAALVVLFETARVAGLL